MFIELIDSLRCTRPHEDTWLVAAFERVEARDVEEGLLGCPVCHAQYPIHDGIAFFDVDPQAWSIGPADARAQDDVLRAAALLGLSEPGGVVALAGDWGRFAVPLAALIDVQLLLVNPVSRSSLGSATSILITRDSLPMATASMRAVALDASTNSPAFIESAVRALRPAGRLVAPASTLVPADVAELARDADVWVAERGAVVSRPVQLGSARRR